MPQPRKYKTDAERQTAYRERKGEREAALRQGLRSLRKEIVKRRKKAGSRLSLNQRVLDYIESELDRLMH